METFNHIKYKPCHVIFRKHDLLIRYKHKKFLMYNSPLTATLTSHFCSAFIPSYGFPSNSPQTETFQYSQHLNQNKIQVVRNSTWPNSQTPQCADCTRHPFLKILSSTICHHHVKLIHPRGRKESPARRVPRRRDCLKTKTLHTSLH